ncbi:MAG TPA: DNA ligase D [Vicinamibacterales bacterium]|nr:DNA ligase D [Vicinamibacterales bacterium]
MVTWRGDMKAVRPMLATLEDAPLTSVGLVYEPKYDGIRALVEIDPSRRGPVRMWSRLGNEKTAQFPDLAAALTRYAKKLKGPVVLDGEIVALDDKGEPAGFQRLQNRIHLTESNSRSAAGRVAFIAFDILRDGKEDVRPLPLNERRARLERVFRNPGSPILRTSEVTTGDARALFQHALEHGWEGLIAKEARSVYHTGKRTRDWRKLKIIQEQEFVVGGWTDSRTAGRPFGALLLGYYEDGGLTYAGHTGSGFNHRELDRVIRLLKPLEIPSSPFTTRPRANQPAHWTKPSLVAQLKFTEWTDDGLLRHPIYLGMRDDVKPETVRREIKSQKSRKSQKSLESRKKHVAPTFRSADSVRAVLDQLDEIERGPGSGTLRLPDGHTLAVTNLRKPFWPKLKITKGDLMRYYVRVAPYILPVVDGRPLIMKRFPNGIDGPPFYQHKAPEKIPIGVRAVKVEGDSVVSRPIGGNLITLLYMTQLASISQDPWFSRVETPHHADLCAIDLDPMPGVKFPAVLDVARWVHDELDTLKVTGYPKTSGASGLHIFVKLREGTPYESGQIFCEIVATMVAEKHPKVATVIRAVRARGQKVYVDYLQNIEGKSLACAYSARASEFAGASTPLTWKEIDEGVDTRDFTIRTLPDRLATVGDLWAPLMSALGVDLRKILK